MFRHSMFGVFKVRYFGVRSKTTNFSSGTRFNSSLFQGGGDGIAMAASEYHLGMQTLQHTSTYISTSAAGETSFVFSSGGSVPDYELGHKTDCKSYFEFARGK